MESNFQNMGRELEKQFNFNQNRKSATFEDIIEVQKSEMNKFRINIDSIENQLEALKSENMNLKLNTNFQSWLDDFTVNNL